MLALLHQEKSLTEQFEVLGLGCHQWMFSKKRNDRVDEVGPSLHAEAAEILSMIIRATVLDDGAAPELCPEEFERRP